MAHAIRILATAVMGLTFVATPSTRTQETRRPGDIDAAVFGGLAWRQLGPLAAGHVVSGSGVNESSHVFYVAISDGGVLKTTDAGQTWLPIFDAQGTGVVRAIATVPRQPDVVYVAAGHNVSTDGLYRSIDGGRSWTRLSNTPAISQLAVASDGKTLWAVSSTAENIGVVLTSLDGGRTFDRAPLPNGINVRTVLLSQGVPAAVYVLAARLDSDLAIEAAPTEIHRSTDDGRTWRRLVLPFTGGAFEDVALASSPVDARRLFVVASDRTAVELYRSDDEGLNWTRTWRDIGTPGHERATFTVIADPSHADGVFIVGRDVRRSIDGGRSFTAWTALPGLEHARLWLHPTTPGTALLMTSRGATVTLNDGASWSNSENQPLAGLERVVTDSAFPYRVCAAGRVTAVTCVSSRGEDAAANVEIGGVESRGAIAIDPGDAEVIFSGRVVKYDRRLHQILDVSPPGTPAAAGAGPAPLLFGPGSSRTLYYATHTVWKSATSGQSWTSIGPVTSEPARITSLSVSAVDARVLWIGNEHGGVMTTRDGGVSWSSSVNPLPTGSAGTVTAVEASHFDVNMAYVAIDDGRSRPQLFKTRDAGVTWTTITRGLPGDGSVRVIREDPYRRGLLFTGGQAGLWVSFNDGDAWQSLQLNLPPTTVMDLTTKDADIVVATAGRGLWSLDDISPLRQVTADIVHADLFLLRPPAAWRMRATATRSPPLSPSGTLLSRTDEGVSIGYVLGPNHSGPVTVEIVESVTGATIRRYSSETAPDLVKITPGVHQLNWDLRYTPRLPDLAGLSEPLVRGLRVAPGTYQVRLTSGSRTLRQAVVVRLDPRIRATPADLTAQLGALRTLSDAIVPLSNARALLDGGRSGEDGARRPAPGAMTRRSVIETSLKEIDALVAVIDRADVRPTPALEASMADALERARQALALEP